MSDVNDPPPLPGPSSVPGPPLDPPPAMPPPSPRSGCLTAFMVIIGIILLLPGVCAVFFGVGNLTSSSPDSFVTTLVMLGLLIGVGGIALIVAAIRGRRP
jgi:hypothetical protein